MLTLCVGTAYAHAGGERKHTHAHGDPTARARVRSARAPRRDVWHSVPISCVVACWSRAARQVLQRSLQVCNLISDRWYFVSRNSRCVYVDRTLLQTYALSREVTIYYILKRNDVEEAPCRTRCATS